MENRHELQATSRHNVRGPKLLLVEDNPEQSVLIRTVLKSCMPEVDLLVASTGEQALSQLRECLQVQRSLPRLILLDLYLPTRQEGWHVLHALKETNSPYRLIPVTLLSHSEKSDDIQTAYDMGANSYISKPVDYHQWQVYFQSLRQYWLHTVTLPAT